MRLDRQEVAAPRTARRLLRARRSLPRVLPAQLIQERALSLGEKLFFLPPLLVLQLVAKRVLLVHAEELKPPYGRCPECAWLRRARARRAGLIPLRDNVASQRLPFVTYAIIATNVAVFWHEMQLGNGLERFVDSFGLIPVRFHRAHDPVARFVPVFTSMFVHGGVLHLLGNMLFLHIFGDNVEDRFGHLRFLAFYLGTGAVAAIAQTVASPHSAMPMVGASGAIAGVTGAYFVLYPRARVSMLVPIFLFWQILEVPAVLFLLLWFAMQLAYGMLSLGGPETGGVAWWAHIGGFGSGVIAALCLRPRRRLRGIWAH